MRKRKIADLTLVAILSVVSTTWAQMGRRGMMPQSPPMVGALNATVGAGAQYQMTTEQGPMSFTIVVVGKESVNGADGTWLENRFEGGRMGGEMVMKQLLVIQNSKADIKRMIMQAPGRPPMEFPMGMMPSGGPQGAAPKDTDPGQKIGTESVTVPAGTFSCDHYQKQTEHGTYDYWISTNISPYPIVKVTGPNTTMVLQKVLTGETSHIHGEPQAMPGMPGMPPH
jgi:hypothetical protein